MMYEGSAPPVNDPYENLAHAIVIKAVEDYRSALKKLKVNAENKDAMRTKRECEQFFSSEWCKFLTNVDMVNAAKVIRQEVYQ